MPERDLRVFLTADTAGLAKGMAEADAATDAAADSMGSSVDKVGEHAGKTEGLVSKLGSTMSNWGVPFGNSVQEAGAKLDEANVKGGHFTQALSDIGKVSLLAGGALAVGVGAESIHMADEFETANSALQTAVHNTGRSWKSVEPAIDATNQKMQSLGFTMTDTEGAMQTLVTATNNPYTAMQDMGLAANLARLKNISLSDATSLLAKVMAGSNRALTQMGLNLDIGSAKLTSIQTATWSVQKAQLALKNTQEGIADGQTKASQAATALASAHLTLSDAEIKLKQDQGTLGTVMDALRLKTDGAAKAFGTTLKGRLDTAGAALENVGVKLGMVLIPLLEDAAKDVAALVGWFEKHTAVAKTLAIVIGTVLGGAIAVFVTTKMVSLVGSFVKFGSAIASTVVKLASGAASMVSSVVSWAAETAVSVGETLSLWAMYAAEWVSTQAAAVASFVAEHAAMAASFIAENAAMAASAVATFVVENAAMLGIGAGIILLVAGIYELYKHWHTVWGWVMDVVRPVWHFIDDNLVQPMVQGFHDAWKFIDTWFVQPLELEFKIVQDVFQNVWHFINHDFLTPIRNGFVAAWHFIDTWFVQPLEQAFDKIMGLVHGAEHVWDDIFGHGGGGGDTQHQIAANSFGRGAGYGSGGTGGSTGNTSNTHIYVTNPHPSSADIARELDFHQRAHR